MGCQWLLYIPVLITHLLCPLLNKLVQGAGPFHTNIDTLSAMTWSRHPIAHPHMYLPSCHGQMANPIPTVPHHHMTVYDKNPIIPPQLYLGPPFLLKWVGIVDIYKTPISKTRPLSSYQLTLDKVMQPWTSDIPAAARQEPTGGPVFILYSTLSSSYIYRYTVLIRGYYYIAIYT